MKTMESDQDIKERKKCKVCKSKNTYYTKTAKFCRACGHEEKREFN